MTSSYVLEEVGRLYRGTVLEIRPDGTILVQGEDGATRSCELLVSAGPATLQPDTPVLCWVAPGAPASAFGVVLGRIGRALAPESPEHPDTLVLEANHSLTLRVGSGSITIREDGKILIKGKDLVSHATRTNRIKGGSVQIN